MRIVLLLLILSFSLGSCSLTEKPIFIEVKSINLIDTSLQNFTVQARVLFHNPNAIGGTLQAKDIHVFIDNLDVATIESELFTIPKKEAFILPLTAIIPFKKVFKKKQQDILTSILKILSTKKIEVNYKGKIRYKLGGFHYDYPLDYKQTISLKR